MTNHATQTQGRAADAEKHLPPEERFWQRFSAHHEFSVSASSSLTVHALLIALTVGLGYLALRLRLNDGHRPLDVTAVEVERRGDTGPARATADRVGPVEAAADAVNPAPVPLPPRARLADVRGEQLPGPQFPNPVGQAVREETQALFDRLLGNRQVAGAQVRGEPGGDRNGQEGTGGISPAQKKRILRWTLIFNTQNGDDYRKQLSALGAILAVPAKDGEYRFIRDLKKLPASGEVEDVKKMDRIFWIDDKPDSVRSLAGALQLKTPPEQIVAFFPKELEDELLRKELAFRNRKENEIKETRFNVVKQGNTYVPVVVGQR